MNSKWLPAPVALFSEHKKLVRTMPWCLEIGHTPVHGVNAASSAGREADPLSGATIQPDVVAMREELIADRRSFAFLALDALGSECRTDF